MILMSCPIIFISPDDERGGGSVCRYRLNHEWIIHKAPSSSSPALLNVTRIRYIIFVLVLWDRMGAVPEQQKRSSSHIRRRGGGRRRHGQSFFRGNRVPILRLLLLLAGRHRAGNYLLCLW